MIGNISQTEGYGSPGGATYLQALTDFRRARQRAAVSQLLSRLNGRSLELLSFQEVSKQLKETGRYDAGLQEIPLNAIVGSVGRTTDFDRDFLPLQPSDAQRWARVKTASQRLEELPPIEVYRIGEVYFVSDGNHRVSIARQQGAEHISAMVIEVKTRGDLPAGASPEDVILGAEQADFLEHTQLDKVRPEADVRLTRAGGYQKLADHIALHRCFIEASEAKFCRTFPEAAGYWHDEAYQPGVETIRERGMLRDFPGWTETDLYLWITENQAKLREALGWSVRPAAVVSNLADEIGRGTWSLQLRRVKAALKSPGLGRRKADPWMRERYLARYSRYLFNDILVLLSPAFNSLPTGEGALGQALVVALGEGGDGLDDGDGARLLGLSMLEDEEGPDEATLTAKEEIFARRCREQGVDGTLAFEIGQAADTIAGRAPMADLIILDGKFLGAFQKQEQDSREMFQALRQIDRPVLFARERPYPLERVCLVLNGDDGLGPALFSATYLAERWGSHLSLIGLSQGEGMRKDKAQKYLTLHEVEAPLVLVAGFAPGTILDAAADQKGDLVVMNWPKGGRIRGWGLEEILELVAAEDGPPILFCP